MQCIEHEPQSPNDTFQGSYNLGMMSGSCFSNKVQLPEGVRLGDSWVKLAELAWTKVSKRACHVRVVVPVLGLMLDIFHLDEFKSLFEALLAARVICVQVSQIA